MVRAAGQGRRLRGQSLRSAGDDQRSPGESPQDGRGRRASEVRESPSVRRGHQAIGDAGDRADRGARQRRAHRAGALDARPEPRGDRRAPRQARHRVIFRRGRALARARRPVAGRAVRAVPVVQRLRRASRTLARVVAGGLGTRRPHYRRAARLHRRHAGERARQPARRLVAAPAHARQYRGRCRRQHHTRPYRRRPGPGADAAVRHGPCHGRCLSTGDEDHRHLVQRAARARHRGPDRRADRGLGDTPLHSRRHRSALASDAPGRIRARHDRRADRLARRERRPVPISTPARFDVRMAATVFRERPLRLACFGYFGHMWELYAMWAWLGVFFAESLATRGGAGYAGLNASLATFVAMAAGAAGCYAGGIVSDRWGRTTLTMAAMALSGLCALLIGLTFGGPPWLTLLVGVVWRVTVIADSAQVSTAVTA